MSGSIFVRTVRGIHARLLTWLRSAIDQSAWFRAVARRAIAWAPESLLAAVNGTAGREVSYAFYRDAVALSRSDTAALRAETRQWINRPLVSVLVAVYDPTPEHFRACVESVLAQAYENWELCLVDDASPGDGTWALVSEAAAMDQRIRARRRVSNGGISAATNDALSLARGAFSFLLDHDDLLEPEALAEMVRPLQERPNLDLIYSDEDKVAGEEPLHLSPHFKPGWSPELLWSCNYITHFAGVRTSLLRQVGGFDSTCDGAQDWDMFLRVAAVTDRVAHVPRVVYGWRLHERSTAQDMTTKPYAVQAQRRALEKAVATAGITGSVVQDDQWPSYWRVDRALPSLPPTSVIVVATQDAGSAHRAVLSVLASSADPNLDVLLVEPARADSLTSVSSDPRLRRIAWDTNSNSAGPFSRGVAASNADVVIVLEPHVEVAGDTWLWRLVSEALRPEVGAVGPMILEPGDHVVRSAGLSVDPVDGAVVPLLAGMPVAARMSVAQHMQLYTQREVLALPMTCVALRRKVWNEVGGLDEQVGTVSRAVDLCCRIRASGYRIVYTPYARVASDAPLSTLADGSVWETLRGRWPQVRTDPFRNPALVGSGSWLAITQPARTA